MEAKTVVVQADDSVSPQLMLEKLLKVSGHRPGNSARENAFEKLNLFARALSFQWSSASGKSVELVV